MENVITRDENVLVALQDNIGINAETQDLINRFCGKVVNQRIEYDHGILPQ